MRLFLNLVLALTLVAGAAAHAGTVGSVNGYVRDMNGKAVSGATVRFESPAQIATTRTDAAGYYAILDLTPGLYKLEISQQRYVTYEAYVGIVADQQAVVDASLHPKLMVLIRDFLYHPATSLVQPGKVADVYVVRTAPSLQQDEMRYIPGVITPIIAPQRGMP